MRRTNKDGTLDKRYTPHSKEHRERISEALKGRKLSEDHKRAIGAKAEGRLWSEERRNNIMNAHLNHRLEAIGGEQNIPEIIKMHNEGATSYAIGKHFDCNPSIIQRVIEDNK